MLRPLAGLVLGVLLLAGCSQPQGPERHDIEGIVTYGGVPVRSGRITFVPDRSKNNSGPVGYAVIENGEYDTADPGGRGSVSGPITVVITGYGEPPAEGEEAPEPLFEDFEATAEIDPSQARTTLDFSVPRKK